jgi:hypothetical protein
MRCRMRPKAPPRDRTAVERDIAEISFPDDPITALNFYITKLRHVLNDSQPI